ncbi:MAG: hypothetical protein LAO21_14520 [Acidobacteriia bacterium]|nr:hypothetical protein [Terriglobia bacterium]
MGRFAEDMNRLCGEIQNLRTNRREFRSELNEQKKARRTEVVEMCVEIAENLAGRAKRARGNRLAFLRNLKQGVAEQKQNVRADLAMARRVWVGKAA